MRSARAVERLFSLLVSDNQRNAIMTGVGGSSQHVAVDPDAVHRADAEGQRRTNDLVTVRAQRLDQLIRNPVGDVDGVRRR